MTIILKENSQAIRERIKEAGIKVCICAGFKDACWLDYHPGITDEVHGVGYYGEEMGTTSQAEECARFLAECRAPVICANVDEFIEKIKETEK